MKKYNVYLSVLICSLVFLFVSCSYDIYTSNKAKKQNNKIVNLTYDVDGGKELEKNIFEYARGTCAENIPTPIRPGYFFGGWYTQKNGEGTLFDTNFVLNDSITVYAKWTLDTSAFVLSVNYTKASQEDGVTITNLNSLSNTCSVYLNENTINLSSVQPNYIERATRDFAGYFDEEGVQICDSTGNLLANAGKYTDSDGRWIYNLRVEQTSLTIYARWIENIKATSITLDSTEFNVGIGETFAISGSYSPADANTTLKVTDAANNIISSFGNIAEIAESLTCENGRFTIKVKTTAHGTSTSYIKCVYNNSGASFTIKSGYVKTIDPDNTLNNIDLPLLTSKTMVIPIEPSNSIGNLKITIDTSKDFPYYYSNLLNFSIENNELVLQSIFVYPYGGNVLNTIPLKIYDSISGLSKEITVNIVPNSEETTIISSIPTVASDDFDYKVNLTQENQVKLFSFNLQKDKGYVIKYGSSSHARIIVYDSSFSKVYEMFASNSISRSTFFPESTGIYYFSVSPYSNEYIEATVNLYIYEIIPLKTLSLSQYKLTLQPKEQIIVSVNCEPLDADRELTSTCSSFRVISYTGLPNGSSSFRVTGNIPGKSTIHMWDSFTGLYVICDVTVTGDFASAIQITPDNSSSENINDYTTVNLTKDKKYEIYKITMESGKTYHYQLVDKNYQSTGNAADGNDKVNCFIHIENAEYDILSFADDNELIYECTESGTYYYIFSAYSLQSDDTGKGAFHVWAEDTP